MRPGYKPLGQMFWLWVKWLQELGGEYVYLKGEFSTKRTGRRDPDKKPRTYDLSSQQYHKSKRGTLTKWSTRLEWGLRPGE
jgi:hypothetical protein